MHTHTQMQMHTCSQAGTQHTTHTLSHAHARTHTHRPLAVTTLLMIKPGFSPHAPAPPHRSLTSGCPPPTSLPPTLTSPPPSRLPLPAPQRGGIASGPQEPAGPSAAFPPRSAKSPAGGRHFGPAYRYAHQKAPTGARPLHHLF